MGYRPNATVYNLHFESPELNGLEVKAKSTTLGKLRDIMNTPVDTKDVATYEDMFQFFASRIVQWNVEHPEIEDPTAYNADPLAIVCSKCGVSEGDPMPATFNSIMCLDPGFILKIIEAWINAIASVEVPKSMSTNNGGITEKLLVTLPTETLPTPNLSTLRGQNSS